MEQLKVLRTNKEVYELLEYLKDKDFVALDTETTGLGTDSTIVGYSVCADTDTAFYVILHAWNPVSNQLDQLETADTVVEVMQTLKTKQLIGHNFIFDASMIDRNFKVSLMDSLHTDTMILAHLLDENRQVGLKELGLSIFGEDANKEQLLMKESVSKNGGLLTKDKYELYKADADLLGYYGAKDALLTLKLFYHMVPELYEQGLDQFFYEDESMPLLKGPTYDLNTCGLRVDPERLQKVKSTLEAECMQAKAFILSEVAAHVKDKYPGTGKTNHFNIGSSKQLAWLLFFKLGNEFNTLTKSGKELCKALDMKLPYTASAKRQFIQMLVENKDRIWEGSKWNSKTKKMARPKKVGDPWNYLACGKETLAKYSKKYKWVETFLVYAKNLKLLNTYVEGIGERMTYNVIRPSFLQHGTTSGRYSSRNPNFQNLPRKDKRVKSCMVARPGKVFVGADYSQLEPRVFASFSGDKRLMQCFINGEDFYSVVGVEVFDKHGCSLKKDDKDSFANLYPDLRDMAKIITLSAAYGTTAPKMSLTLGCSMEEAQTVINNYFDKFPDVLKLMHSAHEEAKSTGAVKNLFGRVRRIPKALHITNIYGKTKHADLPYEIRNILNLAMNFPIQGSGSSIINRSTIKCWRDLKEHKLDAKIVLQVHDSLIVECAKEDAELVAKLMQNAMENTVTLPGVKLEAIPKIGNDLSEV